MANKKNKVTPERLDLALRLCDITLPIEVVEKITEVVRLIDRHGGKTSLKHIFELKRKW